MENYVRISRHQDEHGPQTIEVVNLGPLAHDHEIDIVLQGCVVAQITIKRDGSGAPAYTIYERSLENSRDELVWIGGA